MYPLSARGVFERATHQGLTPEQAEVKFNNFGVNSYE